MKSQTNQAELKCLVLIGNWYQKQSLQLHSQLMNKLRLDAISTISITLSPFICVSDNANSSPPLTSSQDQCLGFQVPE